MSSDKQSSATTKDLKNLTKFLSNPIQTLIETSDNENHKNNNDNNRSNNKSKKSPRQTTKPEPVPRKHQQTSAKNIKHSNVNTKEFSLHDYKHLNKEKLQEIVQRQKDQHDRRIKALEKLTRLEKLQAEKLSKILQMNMNDSICSDAYDSFFKQQKPFPDNEDETVVIDSDDTGLVDPDELALRKEILKEEKKFSKNQKQIQAYHNQQNLSDLTVENESYLQKTPTPNRSSVKKALFESDESSNMSNKNQRKCQKVAVVKEGVSDSDLCSDSDEETDERDSSQEEVKISSRRDQKQHQSQRNTKTPLSSLPVSKPIAWAYNQANSYPDYALTPKVIERSYPCCPVSNRETPMDTKMSLQEAFEMNRYDVISRSRQRQKEIQLRAEQRQKEQEYEIERLAELQRRLEVTCQNHVNQRYIDLKKKPVVAKVAKETLRNEGKSAYFEVNFDNFSGINKRAMSSQEIKSQTRKNYSKLPEVKQKQLQQRAEEIKRRNRLKSDIYKKVGFFLV